MVLYFGCRRRHEDYIYADEIDAWKCAGTLTEVGSFWQFSKRMPLKVHEAFSREQSEKVYVQHLLYANKKSTWRLIDEQGAHVYVCG